MCLVDQKVNLSWPELSQVDSQQQLQLILCCAILFYLSSNNWLLTLSLILCSFEANAPTLAWGYSTGACVHRAVMLGGGSAYTAHLQPDYSHAKCGHLYPPTSTSTTTTRTGHCSCYDKHQRYHYNHHFHTQGRQAFFYSSALCCEEGR